MFLLQFGWIWWLTISTAAWLPVRAVVLLSVPLRKSIVAKCSQYRESTIILLAVSVGIVARNPFACANLARTLRKIQDIWKPSRVKITGNNYLNGLLPFKIHGIHSKSCLLELTIPWQARGPTYQANNAIRKQRNSSPISSRPVMLCDHFRCIFIYLGFKYLRDFGLARSLRVHEFARSLWKACTRVTPFIFLKNKFHWINCRQFCTWLIWNDCPRTILILTQKNSEHKQVNTKTNTYIRTYLPKSSWIKIMINYDNDTV
jgi:hypothetical protein